MPQGTAEPAARAPGRRERSKQAKLARIIAAAERLFAERGVDDVTTQEIAEAADIGAGTLFLYARSKGELLLMVQNSLYDSALAAGIDAAQRETGATDAIVAIAAPIVRCNRTHVQNGRTYLREMVFGDAGEPHHARALEIVGATEAAFAASLTRTIDMPADRAATLAHVVSAAMLLAMTSPGREAASTAAVIDDLRSLVDAILGA